MVTNEFSWAFWRFAKYSETADSKIPQIRVSGETRAVEFRCSDYQTKAKMEKSTGFADGRAETIYSCGTQNFFVVSTPINFEHIIRDHTRRTSVDARGMRDQ
jgi:hypothetical protein